MNKQKAAAEAGDESSLHERMEIAREKRLGPDSRYSLTFLLNAAEHETDSCSPQRYLTTAARKAFSDQNLQNSPLLRLPAELRDSIYGYILGHRRIFLSGQHVRHRSLTAGSVQLSLLQICRQIHSEALPILWSTNTFCFKDATAFTRFFPERTLYQLTLLRNLCLYLGWFGHSLTEGRLHLDESIWQYLRGIHSVELHIETYSPRCETSLPSLTATGQIKPDSKLHEGHVSDFLIELAKSPLQSAKVVIQHLEDSRKQYHDQGKQEAEECGKREYAEQLRKMLLDKEYARDEIARQKSCDDAWAERQKQREELQREYTQREQ